MKILHIIYTVKVSGAENYLKYLLPGLLSKGIECHLIIVCPRNSVKLFDEFIKELKEKGVPTAILAYNKAALFFAARKVSSYCKEKAIGIVHSHLIKSDLVAVLIKKLFRRDIKLISTKHGYDEEILKVYEPGVTKPVRNFYFYLTKFLQKNIENNFAVSQGIADLYYDLGLCTNRYGVIHHGIKKPEYDNHNGDEKFRKATPQLIIVGRLEEFKGHRYLIEALAVVAQKYPECKLLILGEGSSKNNLVAQIERHNLSSNVIFLGFQPFPHSYIINSDVIVLPSLFEPFGLVYIESFALKIPVVAFDTAAGNEIIENDITGLLVPRADSTLLAKKILLLLEDKILVDRLTENAYTVYLSKFTIDTMVTNTAKWYRKNLN